MQSQKATELIEKHKRVLITDVVLTEAVWTLTGKKYQASRDDIIKLVSDLLSEPSITFESPQAVWSALNDFQTDYPKHDDAGRKWKLPDFADALIINKAKQIAKLESEKLEGVFSFDRGALRIRGAREP